ncbi:MAG: SagB/ThcOx family dehydrogenase [Planctomycetota bacterium]|nr:MAG: SagB/ThcOx family dehydrogenase [Planctomycetota bacterium]
MTDPIPLPRPDVASMSLNAALARRRSVREFSSQALSAEQLGALCWAAQGVTHPWGLRTAPSAGALYPLELYVATAEGAFRYLPREHALWRLTGEDLRPGICRAALGQDSIRQSAATFLFCGVTERTASKYGQRAGRYVLLEAGHAAQNLLLEAVALGLGAVPIGAFYDRQLRLLLDLRSGEAPLYLVAVGFPARS